MFDARIKCEMELIQKYQFQMGAIACVYSCMVGPAA
ncbi:hypothetical protein DFP91_4778 [Pseudorhodoplanes sinuspersici]|nr:hypothetical protein DFP91_4778 [Pseudorhodoplanes sinuspersici]